MARHPIEGRGKTTDFGHAAVKINAMTRSALAGVRDVRSPVVNIPVRGVFAGIRIYDRVLIRGAAADKYKRTYHDGGACS